MESEPFTRRRACGQLQRIVGMGEAYSMREFRRPLYELLLHVGR